MLNTFKIQIMKKKKIQIMHIIIYLSIRKLYQYIHYTYEKKKKKIHTL